MSLSPQTLRAARRYGPSVNRLARRRYGISGRALLAKVVQGESGDREDAVSSAGARGLAQFMPSSRQVARQKYGIDPWRSTDEAVHAAALHLRGKINGSKGLEGYNPGDPNYPNYILGQKVGKNPGRGGGGVSQEVMAAYGAVPELPAGSRGIADLVGLSPRSQVQASALPEPAVSARATSLKLPGGYQAPPSGGGPAPRPSIQNALGALIQQGEQGLTPTMTGGGSTGAAPKGAVSAFASAAKAEADHIDQAKVKYSWGGGHERKQSAGSKVTPLDCSGAVSRVLGIDPRVSGDFEKWGKPGRGEVTVYANKSHVLMEINGHFFGTSKTNPRGGPGWIKRKDISRAYLRNFTARHA